MGGGGGVRDERGKDRWMYGWIKEVIAGWIGYMDVWKNGWMEACWKVALGNPDRDGQAVI